MMLQEIITQHAFQVKPEPLFHRQCVEFAMSCIEKGNNTNEERARYLIEQYKAFSDSYSQIVLDQLANLHTDFEGTYQKDVEELTETLDELDETYNRYNGDSIIQVLDGIRCVAYFQTVAELKEAYEGFLKGRHKGNIVMLSPQLNPHDQAETLQVTINIGLYAPIREKEFLPIIGEIQLRLGSPSQQNVFHEVLQNIQKTNDVRLIIRALSQLQTHVKDFLPKDFKEEEQETVGEDDAELTNKILAGINVSSYDELEKNQQNTLHSEGVLKIMKKLRTESQFQPLEGINPPLLILISGVKLTGTSTLATFMEQHIKAEEQPYENFEIDSGKAEEVE